MRTSQLLIDGAICAVIGAAMGILAASYGDGHAVFARWIWLLGLVSMVSLLLFARQSPRYQRPLYWLIVGTSLFAAAHLRTIDATARLSHVHNMGNEITIQGIVTAGCRPYAPPCSFDARVDRASSSAHNGDIDTDDRTSFPLRVRIYLQDGAWSPLPGDMFLADGVFRTPENAIHPYTFDPFGWTMRQGIDAQFQLRSAPLIIGVQQGIARTIAKHRAQIEYRMQRSGHEEAAGILMAMSTATKSGLTQDTRDRFAASGTAHVLAVSGLHLGLLAAALWWGLQHLFRRIPRLLRRWNADALSSLITLPLLALYVIFTGLPTSAMRAGWMAAAILIPRIFGRKGSSLHGLCLAVLCLLIQNPLLVIDLSFQLSVSATLSLVLLARRMRHVRQRKEDARAYEEEQRELAAWDRTHAVSFSFGQLDHPPGDDPPEPANAAVVEETKNDPDTPPTRWQAIRRACGSWIITGFEVSCVSTLATAPFLAWSFGSVPILSPIPNLLIVPPLSLFSLPIGVLGALLEPWWAWGGHTLVIASLWSIDRCLDLARWGAPLFEIAWHTGRPLCLGLIGWFLVAWTSPWLTRSPRIFVIVASLIGFGFIVVDQVQRQPTRDTLEIHAIPVGQGDATWIRFPNGRSMLIDAGGVGYGTTRTGRRYVLPYLRAHGVQKVDILVATHAHADHMAGIIELIPLVHPSRVWVGHAAFDRALDLALYQQTKAEGAHYEQPSTQWKKIAVGETTVEFLSDKTLDQHANINNESLVMRICYKEVCALFTGDLEAEGEASLLQQKAPLRAQYLKIGHHGSKTSSTSAFLDAVAPKVAVIPLGADNRFGFPHNEVLDRLDRRHIRTWRTDRGKAIVHCTDGQRMWRKQEHAMPPFLRRILVSPKTTAR